MNGFHPKRCSCEFCPYFETCESEGTIIDTILMDRQVELKKESYVPIEEAEGCLKLNLHDAFCSTNTGLHLIKAQTGLGKTREYQKLISLPAGRCIMSGPHFIGEQKEILEVLRMVEVRGKEASMKTTGKRIVDLCWFTKDGQITLL